MIFYKAFKVILLATVSGPLLVFAIACLMLLMLVLLILPGWLEILLPQWDKPSGWLRRGGSSCWRLARKILKPDEITLKVAPARALRR